MKKISRRSFLEQLAWTSSALGAVGLNLFPLPGMAEKAAILPSGSAPQFKHPDILRYDAQCFTIHGKDAFLYSACMHYPRTPKALWPDRLLKLKQAGFNTIETYVFWNYHEPVEGQVDMSELADYLKLIHQLGLWSIVRVGPYVCAEWDAGGFPHWLIEKQFPLRSDAPESLRTSKDWYGHVLPVVRENLITRGGSVILVQIENEYDFWHGVPNENKLKYMTVLAETAWAAGIDVPLITNWCKQARENSDPVMAQLTDTCDFYPRWNIVKGVIPELKKLREQEPTSPLGIAELQGGWFSKFGGRLSVDQVGMDGAQLNMLTKTVMEVGTTFLSFYMAHGGTNFDWAAHMLTTTYDYAAPLREPGGLWEKYYAARRIGAFLDRYAPMILRSEVAANGVSSSNESVSATMRSRSGSAVLFVRENADAEQTFKLKIGDPSGSALWNVPRHEDLTIGPRGMKMLPVGWPIGNGRILYSTAEILGQGTIGGRSYVALYDVPGSMVEIALRSSHKPEVTGVVSYVEFDEAGKTTVIGFAVEQGWKSILVGDSLQIVVLPEDLAGRTWMANLPAAVQGGTPASAPVTPVITDCALMRRQSTAGQQTQLTLEFAPGGHGLTILATRPPSQCTVDGSQVPMEHDPDLHTTTIHIETPEPDGRTTMITKGEFRVDSFDPSVGKWQRTGLVALEKLGQVPYGYVKYRASIENSTTGNLSIEAFTGQKKAVFLNGQLVRALSNDAESASCPLAGLAKPGKNLLEISYEAFGSANFGKEVGDLTGVRSIRIGGQSMGEISLQRFPAGVSQHTIDPEYAAGEWRQISLLGGSQTDAMAPAFTWFRARFSLSQQPSWFLPRKLVVESSRDALLYVNGRFVGNYQTVGPQSEFYLPEPYLYEDGRDNVVTVVLAYTKDPRAIRKLTIEPYKEFLTRRTEVRFDWND